MGTIAHILKRLDYPAPITLFIVYNTPNDLPTIEADLAALDTIQFEGGRRVCVLRASDSCSKAENLNLVLGMVMDEFVAIYDADHHADPDSLACMMDMMQAKGCDAVQGSTYIRNVASSVEQGLCQRMCHTLLARFINAELFVQHFVYFPVMEALSASGFFGGSNALWRTSVLRGYSEVREEDIDVSPRAMLNNQNIAQCIAFCAESRSGELSPSDLGSLYRQRLRWAIGWDQVTLSSLKVMWRSRISCQRKCSICFMFPVRWVLPCLSLSIGAISPILSMCYVLSDWNVSVGRARLSLSLGLGYALGSYWLIAISALLRAVQYEHPMQWFWVLFFYCAAPVYVSLNFALVVISAVKIYSGRVGSWVVTRRSSVGASGGLSEAGAHHPKGGDMKKVPSWLAMNAFATGRFNQLDDRLPAKDVPFFLFEDSQIIAERLESTSCSAGASQTPSRRSSNTNVLL